jgi:hypothetical protein
LEDWKDLVAEEDVILLRHRILWLVVVNPQYAKSLASNWKSTRYQHWD